MCEIDFPLSLIYYISVSIYSCSYCSVVPYIMCQRANCSGSGIELSTGLTKRSMSPTNRNETGPGQGDRGEGGAKEICLELRSGLAIVCVINYYSLCNLLQQLE